MSAAGRCLPRRSAIALATITLFTAAEARAEETARGVDIEWIAPDGCGDRARVLAEIDRLLGRSLQGNEGPRLKARAVVAQNDHATWDLELTTILGDAVSAREVHGESCAELAEAAALIIALAVDPTAVASATAATPSTTPPSAPRPVFVAPAPPPIEARPAPGLDVRGLVRVSGVVDSSSLPAVGIGPGLAAGALIGPLRIEAFGHHFSPRSAVVGSSGAGGDVSLTAGGLRFGYALLRGSLDLAPCVGVEAGIISATGFGVRSPGKNQALWLAPEMSALGTYAITSWLRVTLGVEGLFPITRDRFVLTGVGPVHRIPPATARAALGVEVRFP